MNNVSKYKDYSVEDFIDDIDFRNWICSPTEILNSFWTEFQKQHSDKVLEINQARKIVETIIFEEKKIPQEQMQESLDYLLTYLSNKTPTNNKVVSFRSIWNKVAAILLIPLLVSSVYFVYQSQTFRTSAQIKYVVPVGQKSNVILADGTSVWVNSGSTLSISTEYSRKTRKVYLTGEAYFEVTKDNKHPFIVETKNYSVKVYGTKFNVRAYDYQKTSETVLKEGAISVLANTNEEINILPGQRFLINANKQYSISEVNPENYMEWKDNVFKINNEKLEDLISKMEHWYGVEINVENLEHVKNLRYTLTIKTESMKEMLELMSFVTPLTYKIDGEKINLKYKLN
jgi:ferric-dicitrate binding protein FerR (iron transport regulator)